MKHFVTRQWKIIGTEGEGEEMPASRNSNLKRKIKYELMERKVKGEVEGELGGGKEGREGGREREI